MSDDWAFFLRHRERAHFFSRDGAAMLAQLLAGCASRTSPGRSARRASGRARFDVELLERRLLLSGETVAPAVTAAHTVLAASGLDRPVFAVSPPGDGNRLFIVEQHTGNIRILDLTTGVLAPTPFLTVPNVSQGDEQGLLGLAFDPHYFTTGRFFVDFTDASGNIEIWRYVVSATDPNVAVASSAAAVLTIAHPQANHNGGWIGFGFDGNLYISVGDGGNGNDTGTGHNPNIGNAQDATTLLGKILRIDVSRDGFPSNGGRNYDIPPSNPFAQSGGAREVWDYGLRNPWRPSFDRITGDLWIADVGQDTREEVNFQPAGSLGGVNYGWRLREGTIATPAAGIGGPKPTGAIDPIYDYAHGAGTVEGDAVVGGYVYRGPIPSLQGHYVFGDNINSRIWSLQFAGGAATTFNGTNFTSFVDRTSQFATGAGNIPNPTSFGEDGVGNLYIVTLGGSVYKVTAEGLPDLTVYRAYNPVNSLHLFTTSLPEFNYLVSLGYHDESAGNTFDAAPTQLPGTGGMHRMYNPNNGQHYQTLSDGERDFLAHHGWTFEADVGFLFRQQAPGTTEVFHLYNTASGSHIYTIDPRTRDGLLNGFHGEWIIQTSLGFAPGSAPAVAAASPVVAGVRFVPQASLAAGATSSTLAPGSGSDASLVPTRSSTVFASSPVDEQTATTSNASDSSPTKRHQPATTRPEMPWVDDLDRIFADSMHDAAH